MEKIKFFYCFKFLVVIECLFWFYWFLIFYDRFVLILDEIDDCIVDI